MRHETKASAAIVAVLAAAGAPAVAQDSCIVKIDVDYDFGRGTGGRRTTDPSGDEVPAWHDDYDFSRSGDPRVDGPRRQRSPDYLQANGSPTNVVAGPRSDDAKGGFAALYAANSAADADGFYTVYDFTREPGNGLDRGGDVRVTFDYAPGHWHTAGTTQKADAATELRAYVGDGDAGSGYTGQPLAAANPIPPVRLLTGAYAGVDDDDSDTWPDMPDVSNAAPGTSWRTEVVERDLPASRKVYVGFTGWSPTANERAVFLDAVNVLVTSRESDLTLDATGPSGPLNGTDETEFTVTIANEGGREDDPVVSVELPAGFTQRSSVPGFDGTSWRVGVLPIGRSRTLTVPVRVDEAGPYGDRMVAEVAVTDTRGGVPDCDSEESNRSGTEDDEAVVPVTVAARTLGGTVFLDGGQGATAYDGQRGGAERAAAGVAVAVRDAGTRAVLFETLTNAEGAWFVPNGERLSGRTVTVTVSPEPGTRTVSEAPSRTTGDPRDGQVTLTVPSGRTVTGIDFGLLGEPTLVQDRTSTIAPGGTRTLSHRYTASGPGSVTFALARRPGPSADEYEGLVLRDAACDGEQSPYERVTGPLTVEAGEAVCLLVRVSAARSAPPDSTASFALTADTAFGATGLTSALVNTDRLTLTRGALVELTKEVCNLGQDPCDYDGTGFVASNTAAPGEALRYRLRFESVGEDEVDLVTVRDVTPAFTTLLPGTVVAHRSPAGAPCAVEAGGAAPAGYTGELRWACAGTIAPGSGGVVGFDVVIEE